MARKPPALARELLRNFPKRRARNTRRRRKGAKGPGNGAGPEEQIATAMIGSAQEPPAREDEPREQAQDALGAGAQAALDAQA